MKHTKERVLALDYFRGICILAIVINHAMIFSMPYAYLAGAGRWWTGAAEIILIISGLTFGIVRSKKIDKDFKGVLLKTWRRAAQIYVVNLVVVVTSLLLALMLVSHSLPNNVDGVLPSNSGFSLLWSIVNYSYSIGWASFLRLYAVFLLFAPFVLYLTRNRFWFCVPIISAGIYTASIVNPLAFGAYYDLAMWQIYFTMGILMAKFRLPVLKTYQVAMVRLKNIPKTTILAVSGATLAVCILFENNNILYPRIASLAAGGWLPLKLQSGYQSLLEIKPTIDSLFMNSRSGVLRPLIALLAVMGLYVLYQSHKGFLLGKTGKFVITMGQNTLWIFVAQAFAIPLLAALPVQRNFLNNLALTSVLIWLMWLVTKRGVLVTFTKVYIEELKASYDHAIVAYIYRYSNNP